MMNCFVDFEGIVGRQLLDGRIELCIVQDVLWDLVCNDRRMARLRWFCGLAPDKPLSWLGRVLICVRRSSRRTRYVWHDGEMER